MLYARFDRLALTWFRRIHRPQNAVMIIMVLLLLVASCVRHSSNHLNDSTFNLSSAANCRVIHHALGETCVPRYLQRVVVWGGTELDPVLALGVKPIAGTPYILSYVKEKLDREKWEGIESVDSPQGPNLEYLLKLKPDLILGHESRIGSIYSQLSQIAPTVLDGADDWKSTFRLFAEALGQTEKAQQIMDDYDARINRLKAEMRHRLPFTIASIEVRADDIVLDTHNSFAISVIQEAGLSLSPTLIRSSQTWVLSQERLDDLESDAIFLRAWGGVADEQRAAESKLEKLKVDPLWRQLRVVQKGQIYNVGDYFQGGGPITANLILDDLFRYLTPTKS